MQELIKKRISELEIEEKKAMAQLNAIYGAMQELKNLLECDNNANKSEKE